MRKRNTARLTLLVVCDGESPVAGCAAFFYEHRWTRKLEIESLPRLGAHASVFWNGLFEFCRARKITTLILNSYASEETDIPPFRITLQRRSRTEHVLDLRTSDTPRKSSSQHRRNLKRAQKAGLIVRSNNTDEAMRTHVKLMMASVERRAERGESVDIDERLWRRNMAILRAGAGEIFQAVLGGEVISSILVLVSERGAYYRSAGTSAAGRAHGASPYLIEQACRILRERGIEQLNLGGASPSEEGLYRFKRQFGGREVALESGRFYLGNPWLKKARSLARTLRDEPLSVPKSLLSADRFVVYQAAPGAIEAPAADDDICCVKLDDQALMALPAEFQEHEQRFRRLRFNDAYAVLYKKKIAHVAWLVSPEHEQRGQQQNVALRRGEAEITHCLTAPNYRGLGLYSIAIRYLCRVAADQGIRRVYMITNIRNEASQRGIQKAGIKRCGAIVRLKSPSLPTVPGPVIRTHRWPGKHTEGIGGITPGQAWRRGK